MRGEPIERWIGRPGVDADVLFANLQTHGVVRHFSTLARGQYGSSEEVEISAVDVAEGARHCLGFSHPQRRLARRPRAARRA